MEDEIYRCIREEFTDNFDEELELQLGELSEESSGDSGKGSNLSDFRRQYFRELLRLQVELVKLQDQVVANKEKIVVVFEGRD